VKHWQETTRIVDRILALEAVGRQVGLGTVVRIGGSAYRRPGAKLLIEDDGSTHGGVSGGCLEADVREVALQVLRENRPRLRHYDTGTDEQTVWGLGLGCNGSVDVFVQPMTGEALRTMRRVKELLRGDLPFAICTVIEGPHAVGRMLLLSDHGLEGSTGDPDLDQDLETRARGATELGVSILNETAGYRVFIEVCLPPPWLLVIGAGDDAMPLVRFAAEVGFRSVVVDHRPAYLTPDRFPDALRLVTAPPQGGIGTLPAGTNSYAVVMNHSLVHDREWVQRLLSTPVRYIGMLGPRDRSEEILQELGVARGERVYGPVGLDLGADGPEQVALSVVGELLAVRSGREPRHLRDREGAIHAT
jgi:xanthine/CO dehydrogenase XdhC/CoxF family maturation factor